MDCVLGLDIGTTSTAGILIDPVGGIIAQCSRPAHLHAPNPGWAEEDPEEWWDNSVAIVRELLFESKQWGLTVRGVGVSGMLPALVVLDREGRLLRPSIQQSDGRSAVEVEEMRGETNVEGFLCRTGQGINQQLIGPRIRWLEKNEKQIFQNIGTVFGSYDFINWRLTGRRAIERNWALEAGICEVTTGEMTTDLVRLAHLSPEQVPTIVAAHEVLGQVTAVASKETGLSEGTPVVGGAADHIASALAAGVVRRGDVLLKFGGSVDVLLATDKANPDSRLFLDYHLIPGLFSPNGCMSTGGSALAWFAATFLGDEQVSFIKSGPSLYQRLDQLAERVPAGSDGLTVLPYFLGEKTPVHDAAARGVFSGVSLSHTLGHFWRALLEGYAYAIRHHIEVFNEIGYGTTRYLLSDGGSSSAVWMQIVADVLQEPLQCLNGHPGSCLGAAWTAAIGTGLASEWSGIDRFISKGFCLKPNTGQRQVYADGYRTFRSLYRPAATQAGQAL